MPVLRFDQQITGNPKPFIYHALKSVLTFG